MPDTGSAESHPGRAFRVAVAALWVLAVAMITLTPGRPRRPWEDVVPSLCLFCGSRGAADAILNVVLFLPVGILSGYRRGVVFSLVAGFVVSLGIETSQFFLDRNPGLGDLVWNTTGAGIGAIFALALTRWLAPSPRVDPGPGRAAGRTPGAGSVWALALPTTYLLLAGWMAQPLATDARYFGQWTQDLGFMDQYRGELLSAEINGEPVPWGPYPRGTPGPDLLGDFSVALEVVKGPPPGRIAPILSIYDARQREIMVLGAHREDLVWRQRDRALAARFDFRELRLPEALASVAVGDTMAVSARRRAGALCLAVDDLERCDVGFTPGRTWAYLMNLEGASMHFRTTLDTAWMATLFVLVGLLGGGAVGTLALTALSLGSVALAIAITPLVLGGPQEWVGLVLGVALGVVTRPAVGRLVGIATPPPSP